MKGGAVDERRRPTAYRLRNGRSGLYIVPLAALIVAATAVACGSVATEPFGNLGIVSLGDAATAGTTTATATATGTTPGPTSSSSAPPTSSDAGLDASSTPLSACPSQYAMLVDFLNTTGCGQCAGSQCAMLTANCFSDCACITGALAVFGCSVISPDITDCTGLAGQIPAQYQDDTLVCAMNCAAVCSSAAGGTIDSGMGDPITDSGADAHD